LEEGFSYFDIGLILMHADVIQTYVHLYAELSLKKEVENEQEYKAFFHVVYHFCISDCFDPEYDFVYILIKKQKNNGRILGG
jgi:hypothetical protein